MRYLPILSLPIGLLEQFTYGCKKSTSVLLLSTMKYINEEYGFAFRPPFNKGFREIKDTGVPMSQIKFPGKYMQGIGLDYSAINGAMLIGKNGTLWGIRVSYFDGARWLDNEDFIDKLGVGCANTQDGSFAHFTSGPLSVKWVRHNEQSMVIQVSSRKKLRVRIIFYPCYKWACELSIQGNTVNGKAFFTGIVPGHIQITENNAEFRDRFRVYFDDDNQIEYFFAKSFSTPADSANGAFNESIMEFVINKEQPSIYLYALIGDNPTVDDSLIPKIERVVNQINSAELRYGVDKINGTGLLGESAERMTNSIYWSKIYYPFLLTEIFSAKRSGLNNHFDIDGLEENCSALLGCLVSGASYSSQQLQYTLGDKIFSPIVVWHIFCHSSNKQELKFLYKLLKNQYTPNADLIATTTESKSEVAYKWSDSPLKEKRDVSSMYSLDMSCIQLFALDVLSKMAYFFEDSIADDYRQAYILLKTKINEIFWNEKQGLYMNRYVSLRWAGTESIGATSFYVLLAGAIDSNRKLSLIVNNLLNKKKFWVMNPVPTLIATNKEFGKLGKSNNNGFRNAPYLEYRGSIIPYINYIIYHGLVRYGLDEVASSLALSSAKLWINNKSDNVENFSVYLPSGKRVKDKKYLSTNGNMLALIGLQELIDIEYFTDDLSKNAIRFGTFALGQHSLTNIKLHDRILSIEVSDIQTVVLCNGVELFSGVGGKFIIRNFVQSNTGCEFLIDCKSSIQINLNIPAQSSKNSTKYFVIVPIGKFKVIAENGGTAVHPIQTTTKDEQETQSQTEDSQSGII